MNAIRALSTRPPGMKTGHFASIPAGILASRRDVWIFWRRDIEWAPAASDNLTLEDHDATDRRGGAVFDNGFGPVRVERLQVATVTLDDQLP